MRSIIAVVWAANVGGNTSATGRPRCSTTGRPERVASALLMAKKRCWSSKTAKPTGLSAPDRAPRRYWASPGRTDSGLGGLGGLRLALGLALELPDLHQGRLVDDVGHRTP